VEIVLGLVGRSGLSVGAAPGVRGGLSAKKAEQWRLFHNRNAVSIFSKATERAIMNINEQNFYGVDLNLLVTFLVLFREQNVSKTAMLLKVGQPAVSGSLARLRFHFDDPLFLRTGRGVRPTSKAIEIAEALMPAMSGIETVLTHALQTRTVEALSS
jgi:hypothetical protein